MPIDPILQTLFEQAIKQAVIEPTAELVYVGTVKTIGSASDLANTLSNTQALNMCPNQPITCPSRSLFWPVIRHLK